MIDRQLVLARIAYLQAELAALAALVRLEDVSLAAASTQPSVAAPREEAPVVTETAPVAPARPVRPAKRAKAPARWSYVPSAAYRLVGPNPFRDGNNYALFDHLAAKYDGRPFSRVQLGREIHDLQDAGTFKSSQPEHQLVVGFVSFAGGKGRLEMATAPAAEAEAEAESAPSDAEAVEQVEGAAPAAPAEPPARRGRPPGRPGRKPRAAAAPEAPEAAPKARVKRRRGTSEG